MSDCDGNGGCVRVVCEMGVKAKSGSILCRTDRKHRGKGERLDPCFFFFFKGGGDMESFGV